MNENPFNFGKPAKGEDFFNRSREIETAIGFVRKLQSFSVVGERRMGKTSLLEHIFSAEVLKIFDLNLKRDIIIYFNLGGLHEITKNLLIGTIIREMKEQTQIEVDAENVFEELKAYVKKLALERRNLIIALDEFEVIESILDESFSHWLRSIFQESNVMAITASQTTVGEIRRFGARVSPLFNIFGNVFLKPFSKEETGKMISEMFLRGGEELDEKEISFLTDLSGGNPYLTQFTGFHYYEERKRDKEIIQHEFENKMLDQLENIFEGYWKYLNEKERKFLFDIENIKNNHLGFILERRGFVKKVDGKMKIFSLLFREFIMRKRKEFELSAKKSTKTLPKWALTLICILLAALIGMAFYEILKTAKLPEWLDSFVQWCSLAVSILSFIISFLSLKKYQKKD